jgi:soluble lytic murein transglycosylase-like protein
MRGDRGLALAAVAALLVLGYVMIYRPRKSVADELRAAADRYGLPGDWLVALGITESGLDPGARNLTGPDADRGGAWGPTQITARTARAFGYTGPMEALTTNPALAADLTGNMISQGFAERSSNPAAPESGPFKVARYGTPATFEDMIAVWNAGKPFDALSDTSSTLASYYPRALSALASLV